MKNHASSIDYQTFSTHIIFINYNLLIFFRFFKLLIKHSYISDLRTNILCQALFCQYSLPVNSFNKIYSIGLMSILFSFCGCFVF